MGFEKCSFLVECFILGVKIVVSFGCRVFWLMWWF